MTTKTNLSYTLKTTAFDKDYQPSDSTRTTTNFANLARGPKREENLQNTLHMINNHFNALAVWDNPDANRYEVQLEIISVELDSIENATAIPMIEMLKTYIYDRKTDQRTDGIVGNNFSSYLRDYDFSVWLPEYNKNRAQFTIPPNFGDLHGELFKRFINSSVYQENFAKPPIICLSVSDRKTYIQSNNQHPILGVEYLPEESSLTEQYFMKMGLQVRYFMLNNSVAPLSFYFFGDLLNDYTPLELIGVLATMETFQKIYRPEIYNANTRAGKRYRPSLKHKDYSLTQIEYDREERSALAVKQGLYAQEFFVNPYQARLRAELLDLSQG